MYSVYVIKSAEGFVYIGQTNNLENRLKQHNSGNSKWTKRGSNWELIHVEEFGIRADAMKREKWLKTGAGKRWLKKQYGSLGS